MQIELVRAPFPNAPVLLLIAGLGGTGSYWLPQRTALAEHYQLVIYDQRGTGANPQALPDDYSLADMAHEIHTAMLQHGLSQYSVLGHALGGLVAMQLALDFPDSIKVLAIINGWLQLNAHTRRCFAVRETLLRDSGPAAYLQAQPLFLYPADWMAANQPQLEAEEALHNAHFQGRENLTRRLNALKAADFSASAARIHQPVVIICSRDDLLVPWNCSVALHNALANSVLEILPWGGHACNVTAANEFNPMLIAALGGLLATESTLHKESV
ncbi:pyrimidine utilization protein D [Buttiauxella sp.]|uniref:pyrimidine utilization protein D n=1 Tax=Buttiauxella sp. TaxID=1972222 RepID=UPI003C709E44